MRHPTKTDVIQATVVAVVHSTAIIGLRDERHLELNLKPEKKDNISIKIAVFKDFEELSLKQGDKVVLEIPKALIPKLKRTQKRIKMIFKGSKKGMPVFGPENFSLNYTEIK